MIDQERSDGPPDSQKKEILAGKEESAFGQQSRTEDGVPPGPPAPENQLSPEEQMALFEKDLKENDWGHQPC